MIFNAVGWGKYINQPFLIQELYGYDTEEENFKKRKIGKFEIKVSIFLFFNFSNYFNS